MTKAYFCGGFFTSRPGGSITKQKEALLVRKLKSIIGKEIDEQDLKWVQKGFERTVTYEEVENIDKHK